MDQTMAPMIGFLVLIFVAMYFLMIRPQRKRQREQEDMKTSLRKGDRVITIGGIYGRIESIGEDTVVLKVESGATMKLAKGSIAGQEGKQIK